MNVLELLGVAFIIVFLILVSLWVLWVTVNVTDLQKKKVFRGRS